MEAEMVAPSTGAHRHRSKKSRVASCLNCRDRKLKCDRRMPCGTCVEREEVQLCKWAGVRQDAVPLAHTYPSRYQCDSLGSFQRSQGSSSAGPRELLSHLHECQRRLNQVQSIVLEMPHSSMMINSSPKHLALSEIYSDDWKAIYAISLLAPLDELKEAISYYFHTIGISFYAIEETSFINQFQRHYPRYAQIQASIQRGQQDNAAMSEAYRQWHWVANQEDTTFLGLLLGVYGMSLIWGYVPHQNSFVPAQKSSSAFAHVAMILEACHQLFKSVEPLLHPTLDSLRLCIALIVMNNTTKGTIKTLGLLAEGAHIAMSLSLDKEPGTEIDANTARDRIHLFVTLTTFDWMGSLTFKPYLLLPRDPLRHPLLYGEPGRSRWSAEVNPDAHILTERMRFKTLLASTARNTFEHVSRNTANDAAIVEALERDWKELDKFVPKLVTEVGYKNERAIAHATDLKAFIAIQRLSFTRDEGEAKARQLYKGSQKLVSMVADTIREIASPTLPGHHRAVLIYGIRSDIVPLLWYSLQSCAIGLSIIEKAQKSGIRLDDSEKMDRDNDVCRGLFRELELHGMSVKKAITARSLMNVFDDEVTTDISPQTGSTGFPSNFDELNEFLAYPLLPMERDYHDLMSFSLPPIDDMHDIQETAGLVEHHHPTLVGLQG